MTNNLPDFRPLHAALIAPGRAEHSGRVFVPTGFRLTKEDRARIVAAFEGQLAEVPGKEDLAMPGCACTAP